jgi:drug/metabolite transporter (DMT)-like permease
MLHASWVAPALALVFNALVWGLSWWPLRELQARGLHPLWATVVVYALAVAVIGAWRPRAWTRFVRRPAVWVLVLASGTTNAAFNWAVATGDVVRVVLLFYLMPLWAVLLARPLLGERADGGALLRVALALGGAGIVLWPEAGGALPLPRELPDFLGLLGGFAFALNNVMLRRLGDEPDAARALAMFVGGVLVAGGAALALGAGGDVPPPGPSAAWLAGALLLALLFLLSNLALQHGAARLPAHVTAVVMLSEVLFAALSAAALGAAELTPRVLAGGALIVLGALLAVRPRAAARAA